MDSRILKQIKLYDDNTLSGGTAYHNESLYNFLLDIGEENETDTKVINDYLVQCGILPVFL